MTAVVRTETLLVGRALSRARALWIGLALLLLVPTTASWPAYLGVLRQVCASCLVTPDFAQALRAAGWSVDGLAVWRVAWPVVITLGWAGVGLLIFARRSADRRALAMSALLVMVAPGFGGLPFDLGSALPAWRPLVQATNALGGISAFALILTVPNGRLAPRWTAGLLVYLVLIFTPNSFWPDSVLAFSTWPGWATAIFIFGPLIGTLVGLPIYRYRRVFTLIERQQAKWVVVGLVAAALGIIATLATLITLGPRLDDVPPSLQLRADVIQDVGYFLSTLLIPAGIGIAVLRSRLWDIDLIIRRTLIYSVLSGVLALAYFGSVVVLESVFRALTGQGQNALVVVLSTLAIAALFVPVRARVQRAIDRRFYRKKYDAARTLAGFGAQARDEVDLDRLSGHLIDVVDQTMQPASVDLWLRKGP